MSTPVFIGLHIACPLCAGSDLICVGEHDRHGQHLRTDLCRTCGHVFTNPQPTSEDLDRYYTDDYRTSYKGVVTPKPKHVYRAGLRALERLERLKPFLNDGAQILDIGAGGGEFTYLMTQAGFAAQGIEPNRGYAAFAKAEYQIDIDVGTVEDVLRNNRTWEVITLHHVLEHLADPVTVLKGLAAHLSDEGVIVIEVPNVEARYHAPQRRFHFAHLHTFSREGLIFAAGQAGLTLRDMTIQPHTGHLNGVFDKSSSSKPEAVTTVAHRIERFLKRETVLKDTFSIRPYRRLWANLRRPLREKRALKQFGPSVSAKAILDQLYAQAFVLRSH